MGNRVVRIQLNRPPEFPLAAPNVPLPMKFRKGQRAVALGERSVQLDGFLPGRKCQRKSLAGRHTAILPQQIVAVREARVSGRIRGVALCGCRKIVRSLRQVYRRPLAPMVTPLQVKVFCFMSRRDVTTKGNIGEDMSLNRADLYKPAETIHTQEDRQQGKGQKSPTADSVLRRPVTRPRPGRGGNRRRLFKGTRSSQQRPTLGNRDL